MFLSKSEEMKICDPYPKAKRCTVSFVFPYYHWGPLLFQSSYHHKRTVFKIYIGKETGQKEVVVSYQ